MHSLPLLSSSLVHLYYLLCATCITFYHVLYLLSIHSFFLVLFFRLPSFLLAPRRRRPARGGPSPGAARSVWEATSTIPVGVSLHVMQSKGQRMTYCAQGAPGASSTPVVYSCAPGQARKVEKKRTKGSKEGDRATLCHGPRPVLAVHWQHRRHFAGLLPLALRRSRIVHIVASRFKRGERLV